MKMVKEDEYRLESCIKDMEEQEQNRSLVQQAEGGKEAGC